MKRAAINLTLENVIGLILAAIIIPGLAYFAISIISAVTQQTDQGTLNSFDQLKNTVEDLLNVKAEDIANGQTAATRYGDVITTSDKGVYTVEIPYYIENGKILAGFDSDAIKYQTKNIGGDWTGYSEHDLSRPSVCLSKSCLCIAKNLDNKEGSYDRCAGFDNLEQISLAALSNDPQANLGLPHANGAYLVLKNDGKLKVNNIKITRIPKDDGNFDVFLEVLSK